LMATTDQDLHVLGRLMHRNHGQQLEKVLYRIYQSDAWPTKHRKQAKEMRQRVRELRAARRVAAEARSKAAE
jgi:hypothetical protein